MPNEFVNPALRPSVYFYHIPKTGGMSLRGFLADQYPDQDRCPRRGLGETGSLRPIRASSLPAVLWAPLGQSGRLSTGWRSHPDVPAQPGGPDHIDDPAPDAG